MDKYKVDLLIKGNLICNYISNWGGVNCVLPSEVEDNFDVRKAIVIDGDLCIDSFDSGEHIVVVTGAVTEKGGIHE